MRSFDCVNLLFIVVVVVVCLLYNYIDNLYGREKADNCPYCQKRIRHLKSYKRSRHIQRCLSLEALLAPLATPATPATPAPPTEEEVEETSVAHFMFFDIGSGSIDSCPHSVLYNSNLSHFRKLHPSWQVTLWGKEDVRKLVMSSSPHLLSFWEHLERKENRNPFYLIDFSRYVILALRGGIYIDLDIKILKKLEPNKQYVLSSKKTGQKKRKITNSFICLTQNGIYEKLIQFIISKYFICEINKDWDRHLLHSVGALAFSSFCGIMKIKPTLTDECDWIRDYGTTAWVGLNKTAKK